MSKATTLMIKQECERFARMRGIPEGSMRKLQQLATQSYYNMPAKERRNWSLEMIVKQGI